MNNLLPVFMKLENQPCIEVGGGKIAYQKINQLLDTQSQYTKKQIVDAMKSSTNFYLSYQGRNDINLQQKYANLIERLTEKIYPQFHQERTINKSKKFIKIGFVSSFFKNHTISMMFKNWLIKFNRNFFKESTVSICPNGKQFRIWNL